MMALEFEFTAESPVRVGLVGTGFAAQARVAALQAEPRATAVAVAGHRAESVAAFAQQHHLAVSDHWQALVQRPDLDLVVVGNVNSAHGEVVRAALTAGKAVVVEYPLALDPVVAAELLAIARDQRVLLHVEHIELLGGLHQAVQTYLPRLGTPRYVRYCTAVPQTPAPQKWTYHRDLFGFPLLGALSRVHRLTNLFGAVATVACQLQYDQGGEGADAGYFRHCRCTAQLQFQNGVVAELLYAKGEHTWRSQRWMEIEGDRGALVFDGDAGQWLSAAGAEAIAVGTRRGLFAQDTTAVLDALLTGKPLYVNPAASLYALQVAAAAAEAARTGATVPVTAPYPADS
ncbi:MAG TPA: Gfo/Idh/MocA family oxidoreductase [Candidatus Obscuribacterales bacterium]